MATTNWRRGWTSRESRHGTRSGSTAGLPSEEGGGVDKDIVNMNRNYINNIQSNPKLVRTVDELAVAGTGAT